MRVSHTRSVEVDQRVILAFLSALRAVQPGAYVTIALRRTTAEALFDASRLEQREAAHSPFDEATHPANVFGIDATREAAAAELTRIVAAEGGADLRDAILATRGGDESLRAYVARLYPAATPSARASIYERLLRGRDAVESVLRVRLATDASSRAA